MLSQRWRYWILGGSVLGIGLAIVLFVLHRPPGRSAQLPALVTTPPHSRVVDPVTISVSRHRPVEPKRILTPITVPPREPEANQQAAAAAEGAARAAAALSSAAALSN